MTTDVDKWTFFPQQTFTICVHASDTSTCSDGILRNKRMKKK